MAAVQIFKMVTSPDDPQGKKMKALLNKFLAAVLVFFTPFLVNLAVSLLPESFSIQGCWQSADDMVTRMNELEDRDYDPFDDNKTKIGDEYSEIKKNIYIDPDGESGDTNTATNDDNNNQSVEVPSGSDDAPKKIKKKRKKVVNYAKKFVGNPYVSGGCSLTNGVDCSCFVKQVYAKYGYTLKRTAEDQANDKNYKDVKLSDVQPGDLLFYYDSSKQKIDHVSMYIGSGQVIHASNPKSGIKISGYGYRNPSKAKRIIAYKGS